MKENNFIHINYYEEVIILTFYVKYTIINAVFLQQSLEINILKGHPLNNRRYFL